MTITPILQFGEAKDKNIRDALELATFVENDDRIQVSFLSDDMTASPEEVVLQIDAYKRTSKRPEQAPFKSSVAEWVSQLAVFSEVALEPMDIREISVSLAAVLSLKKLEVDFVHTVDRLNHLVRNQYNG